MAASIISAITEPVMYGSPVKMAIAVLFSGIWLWSTVWLDRDAGRFLLPRAAWSGAYLAAGVFGLFIWIIIGSYAVGIILFLAIAGGTFAGYVVFRNGRVNEAFAIFTPAWFSRLKGGTSHKLEARTRIPLYDNAGRPVILTDEKLSNPMFVMNYNLTQDFLFSVAAGRAAEAAVDPAGEWARCVYLIDGIAIGQQPLHTEDVNRIAAFIKDIGGMSDKSDKPQKGMIGFDMAGKKIDVEATISPSNQGDKIRLRILNEVVQTNLDELGLSRKSLAILQECLEGSGMIIVSGLPKSGLTSTLFSITKKIDPYLRNIIAVEHKPAAELTNVSQHVYNDREEYRQTLVNVLRHDPDVIMADGCFDSASAELLGDFAKNKLVIIAIPATETAEAILRWKKLGGSVDMVKAVTSQILLRKICTNCREEYPTTPELLEKMRLPANVTKFYRTPKIPADQNERRQLQYNPCPACNECGYFGRTAAFEVMQVDNAIRQAAESGNIAQIRETARKSTKMLTLQEQIFVKVAQGITSLEEAQRVLKIHANQLQQLKGGKAK